jgi:hypothetical protein
MPWPRSVFCWTGPGRPADHDRGCDGPDRRHSEQSSPHQCLRLSQSHS